VFIAELRPKIDPDYVPDRKGKGWKHVEQRALNSEWATDAHFVKGEFRHFCFVLDVCLSRLTQNTAIRAMKEAARTWGDVHDRYLTAAVRFADEFEGWVH
jgi:hypothetical protein